MNPNARIAKNLRRSHIDAERLLWKHLRAKQIEGVTFRRQQPIGRFIVDFISFEVLAKVSNGHPPQPLPSREGLDN